MFKKSLNMAINISISIFTLLALLIVLELGFGIYLSYQQPDTPDTPMHIPTDKPYLYGMNPEHDRINRHGLRDNDFEIEKPVNTYRILVLGDSIPFGDSVRSAWTFPNRLEALLNETYKHTNTQIEVINSGVSGYTPYNELHYYLSEGRKFDADLVILSFCMNDIVNPRLHWNISHKAIKHIPSAAIPNKSYDSTVIQPLLKERDESAKRKLKETKSFITTAISQTKTYQYTFAQVSKLFPTNEQKAIQSHQADLQMEIPVYITGEDNISIELLTKPDNEEWLWLTNIYNQVRHATDEDDVPLVLAIFPLAYQLDPNYPHFPQKLFAKYCKETGTSCVDMLDTFSTHGKEKIFMLGKWGGWDIWHLTADGHMVTAQAIQAHLQTHPLIKLNTGPTTEFVPGIMQRPIPKAKTGEAGLDALEVMENARDAAQ